MLSCSDFDVIEMLAIKQIPVVLEMVNGEVKVCLILTHFIKDKCEEWLRCKTFTKTDEKVDHASPSIKEFDVGIHEISKILPFESTPFFTQSDALVISTSQ